MLFRELSEYYKKLEGTSSRLSMMDILAELFKKASAAEIDKIVYMTQGVLAPPFEGVEFGLAAKMAEDSIAIASGYTKQEIEKEYQKSGDLGTTAEKFLTESKLKRMASETYTVLEVYSTMLKISKASGPGSKDIKTRLLASLIAASSPLESRYLVRYPLGQLRLGAGDSTMLEALSVMSTGERKLKEPLERAYNICSDLGLVAKALADGGESRIKRFNVMLFKPIRPALAERLPTPELILEKMHGKCSVEQKYDGFRCQIHKKGAMIKIYSRRLEDITEMFPDIAKATIDEVKADSIIFEGEALAYNEATGEYMQFQETIQRKRKHSIKEKIEELPLHLMAFDIMYLNGEDMLNHTYESRRAKLEVLLKNGEIIMPAKRIMATTPKDLDEFFQKSIGDGLEGIVAKDLQAHYIAGARKFSWIKMKRSYRGELSDTLDLVIIGYYSGHGSRAEFQFGGLLGAVYNKKRDMFETVSRIGTGFTEKQMTELKEMLSSIQVKSKPARVDSLVEPDFWVYPKYVITVRADEITRSPMHTCGRSKDKDGIESGYALRFPRLVGDTAIRSDKGPEDATETSEVIEMYNGQRKVRLEDK